MSDKKSYREMINILLDEMQQETVERLLATDAEYQRYKSESEQLYDQYRTLDVPEPVRCIVDGLLRLKDNKHEHHLVNVYLAGLLDSRKVMEEFGGDLERNLE